MAGRSIIGLMQSFRRNSVKPLPPKRVESRRVGYHPTKRLIAIQFEAGQVTLISPAQAIDLAKALLDEAQQQTLRSKSRDNAVIRPFAPSQQR